MERRRRLRYPLAVPARELLAHRLNHLPPARDHLQRLRHVLADFGQLVRPTARAGRGHGNHHALARQVVGERFARGPAADEPLDLSAPGRRLLSRQLVLGCTRLELVERELHLVEQALLALRAPAVERATELLDHQGQGGNLRLGSRRPRLLRRKCRFERFSVVRIGGGHGRERITSAASRQFLTGPGRPDHGQTQLSPPATAARCAPGCATRSLPAGSQAAPR